MFRKPCGVKAPTFCGVLRIPRWRSLDPDPFTSEVCTRRMRVISFLTLLVFCALLQGLAASSNSGPKKTVLVLGDSISAGYGLDPDEAYPALLERKIDEAGLPYKIVNAGVSGDTTAGGLRRISWLLRQPVDVLLLELGGNDGLRGISPDETARNIDGIIQKVREKYPSAKVIIAGMQMPEIMGGEYARKFRATFVDAARKNSA